MSTYKMPQIQRGDTGTAVAMLQGIMAYRKNGKTGMPFYVGEIDGEFGQLTYNAVYGYQKIMKEMGFDFAVDGICGDQTWDSILGSLPRA